MKKIISLILATLMCATMAPAVLADDAAVEVDTETAAVAVADEAAEETAVETAIDLEWVNKTVVVSADHLAAISGATAEEVTALVGDREITEEVALEVLTALGCTITAEEIPTAVYAVATPIEKYEVTYMSAKFAMYLCNAMGAYVADGEVDEVYAAFELVAEAGMLTPAFIADTLTIAGLETTEADVYVVIANIIEYVVVDEATEETAEVEEVAETEAVVEVVEEEAVETAIEEVEEVAITEEAVEEVVSKYPVILEEIPTFGLFTRIPSVFTFRG